MASSSFGHAALNHLPIFTGSNYTAWKKRMKQFMWGIDEELWLVVQNGPVEMKDEEQSIWLVEQKKSAQLNQRAMHVLQSAMNPDEADQVENCAIAWEIWTTLESTYEGTSNIKESRIDLLVHDYEAFSMSKAEGIHEMYSRFTILINKLKGLGKTFQTKDLNRKILRSLPREWLPKRTAIEEAKNLSTLPISELIGSLLSHEHVLKQVSQEDEKRSKNLAFKSKVIDYEQDSDMENDFEKEFALVSKRFHRMLKFKNGQKQRLDDSKYGGTKNHFQSRLLPQQTRKFESGQQERESQACYKCGKFGHIRAHCPQTIKAKEKAMKASWSDYDTDQEEQESENEAFMARTSPIEEEEEKESAVVSDDHKWYLDSGCSHHMSGKKLLFSSLTLMNGGKVWFGDNGCGKGNWIWNCRKKTSSFF
ncbi:unnamed protein product [Linum trigynum]|uniref:CCHC-type domain-containing protein n=1 Tax=Linum trigynum TaxID=586398 RepID=A0AAV2EA07_9ROSI